MSEQVGALVYEDDLPISDALPKETVTQIERPTYKSNVIDTRYEPKDYITTFIEGTPWVVNYYSQVLGTSDENSGNVGSRTPPHQAYTLLKDFELRVIDTIDGQSQNTATKEFDSVTGTANVHPVLTPNKGDLFIADVGDGRAGVFEVTSTRKLTIWAKAAYQIDYVLRDYVTPSTLFDLDRKVVKTYHWRGDFMNYGASPLVDDENLDWVQELEASFESIMREWWKFSFSNETRSIVVPGQGEYFYDPYLTKAMVGVYKSFERDFPTECRILNVDHDDLMRCFSLWDLLQRRDPEMLRTMFRTAGRVNSRMWPNYAIFASIHHSMYRWVIYPADETVLVDYHIHNNTKSVDTEPLINQRFRVEQMKDVFTQQVLPGFPYEGKVLAKPVNGDSYYVLSEDFYLNGPNKSALESLVWDYVHSKPVNPKVLLQILSTRQSFGSLERFYYYPILMFLIYDCMYSSNP